MSQETETSINNKNKTANNENNIKHIININNTKDFEIIDEIPSLDNYIKIYKVLRKIDQNYYILLQYPLDIITKTMNDFQKLEYILEKIKILLTKINNKNILNIKESFIEKSNQSVVMILELYENKNLQKNVLSKYKLMRERYIPENILLDYLYNIADGINILHENNLFNIDLNPSNIFIDNNNNIKLNPYICLNNLCSENPLYNNNDKHFKVKAPELIKNKKNYTKKSDVWYFGLLVYELSQLKPINKFYYNNVDNIYNYIIKGQYTINSYYSKDIKELIKLCLQYSPIRRPTCEQLLKIIDLYRKNKTLNEKMKIIRDNNRKGKFFRKINLKTEIEKFNKTLNKLKNYERYKNRNRLNRTPTIFRKTNRHLNINININNKTFNKINLTKNNSKETIIKNGFKSKKCVIDRKNKIHLNISGKKPYNTKNNTKRSPSHTQLKRNKSQNRMQTENYKIPLIVNIIDDNAIEKNNNGYSINKTYNYNGLKKVNTNSKINNKICLNKDLRKKNNMKGNKKRENLSNSFCYSKLKVKK